MDARTSAHDESHTHTQHTRLATTRPHTSLPGVGAACIYCSVPPRWYSGVDHGVHNACMRTERRKGRPTVRAHNSEA
eukprot:6048350-Prymnesium_polylepis.1